MSVKSATFDLCKHLMRTGFRQEVKATIESLNVFNRNDPSARDRTHFGYVARHQYQQFLGYLLVDLQRERLRARPMPPIPSLEETERELLRKAHFTVCETNHACLKQLLHRLPNLSDCLNPYAEFRYPALTYDYEALTDRVSLDQIVDEFSSLQIIKDLTGKYKSLASKVTQQDYNNYVFMMLDRITRAGALDSPEDYKSIERDVPSNHPARVMLETMHRVIALRGILLNLCQLLFQAFTQDGLVALTEDNIIEHPRAISTLIGEGMDILVQLDLEEERVTEAGAILLVRPPYSGLTNNQLGRVEAYTFSDSGYGFTQHFELRMIDDDLNPYFGLIR